MLTAKNITFRYFKNSPKNILENFNLCLEEGKTVLLCGTSGCGKSTLAYILAGLYPENTGFLVSGEVFFNETNIHDLTADKRAAYVSMMFQNCDLQFCMNNLKNELKFCLENISVPQEKRAEIIENAIKQVGAENLLERNFNKMSGGEKQKCALACILVLGSKCIILDEAFANIDTKSAKEIISVLKKLNVTILAIDHNTELWQGSYDRIINMDDCKTIHSFDNVSLPDKTGENIVVTRNLSVNNIKYPDMEFTRGSITAILGASGSGKTTFFKTLIRQNKYKGNIAFFGRELSKINKTGVFLKCGIVFQNPSNQFLAMTVYDEILFSVKRWNKKKDAGWQAQKTEELLLLFDLAKYRKYAPYILSQGQQRRLAVLSMIAGSQEILLLDEPTYGQDYENICNIMNLLLDKAKNGLTIIFNTHNEKVAEHFSHRIIRIGD